LVQDAILIFLASASETGYFPINADEFNPLIAQVDSVKGS